MPPDRAPDWMPFARSRLHPADEVRVVLHDKAFLIAMLRLLAESRGRMTPAGISLELSLSHETLGQLIGARRPTVTLGLKELAEQKALVRQGKRWLIIEE